MSIRVAIADDHLLIISSIENTLKDSGYIEVCGKYTSGSDLLSDLQTIKPDVLLLDYHLPDYNGAQLARTITYHYPKIKILVLTGFDGPGLITEMLENGCMGYLLKSTANEEILIKAIDTVYNGQMYIDSTVREKYSHSIRTINMESDSKPKLTNREVEILREIAAELSSQEIADKLCISKRTVENHRNSLMIKSGAKNIVGLIKFAMTIKIV